MTFLEILQITSVSLADRDMFIRKTEYIDSLSHFQHCLILKEPIGREKFLRSNMKRLFLHMYLRWVHT